MFLAVSVLERRKLRFEEAFPPGAISFADQSWEQEGDLTAAGSAELLDRSVTRTIRVRGHLDGSMAARCARCLEPVVTTLEGDFDLFYYPMSLIARNEAMPIDRDDTDMGFYEGAGLELRDVVREQVALWQPMRALCRENCQGLCPNCGANRNQAQCACGEKFLDPRWDVLRQLTFKHKQ